MFNVFFKVILKYTSGLVLSVCREQLIFDCMIANLFEEYKFFPKYPDRQLKLAAVLFGEDIQDYTGFFGHRSN